MTSTVVERYGSLSATGGAREATFGTPLTPTTFLPMTGNELQLDPGLFSPKVMFGQRDVNTFPLFGQYKNAGGITGPLFPTNGALFIPGSIGPDASVGYGVAAATPTTATSNTLNGATTAGATTVVLTSATGFVAGQQVAVDVGYLQEIRKIASVATNTLTLSDALTFAHASGVAAVTGTTTSTLNGATSANATTITVTSGAGFTVNNIIQVDVNTVAGVATSEVRKITNIATNVLTLDSALTYAHGNGSNVIIVSAPYTHQIQQANLLSAFTVEKNLGGFESLQFAGSRVGKLSVTATATDAEATVAIDMVAKSVAVLATPTAISITNETPFVFAEATVSLFGNTVLQASTFSIDIDNGLKSTYTMNATHNLNFLTPVTRHVSGKIDVVFTSLDDAAWGYFNLMTAGTTGALTLALVHPTTGGSVMFYMPKVLLKMVPDSVKFEDVIMTSLEYEVFLNLATLQTISATVVDQTYVAL